MRRWLRGRALPALMCCTVAVAAATALVPISASAKQVSGAVNTTDDPNWGGPDQFGNPPPGAPTQDCLNGPPGHTSPAVNCNIYAAKTDVFLSGSPNPAALGVGTYFFVVLYPGGQPDPNDATGDHILSTDPSTNREFSSDGSGGVAPLNSTHSYDAGNNVLQLVPYADTPNQGGVYILATCQISTSQNDYQDPVPTVKASDCKYDAFKVNTGGVTSQGFPLTVTKDAEGSFVDTWKWGINKDVDATKVVNSNGSATFNYTVIVNHDGGTVSDVVVKGTIQVLNPNIDSSNNVEPVTIDTISDKLSDGTTCTITGGGAQTLSQFETDFAYTCSLSGLPQGNLDNTATVTWSQQALSGDTSLDAGSATFTFSDIAFDETKVDDCVTVSDTLGGSLGQLCSTDPSPTSFTYPITVQGTPGKCVTQNNTATFTTDTTGTTGSASQSVQMCTPEDLQVTKNATPGFDRTYNWAIAKSVSQSVIKQLGGTATVTYTVTVTQTGSTDSGWHANGQITLTNPNDFFDFTGVNVTDAVDNGGTCTVTNGTNVTVAAGKSVTRDYSCTYASQPAYNSTATNTATATWSQAAFSTPGGSGSGQATFTFNDGTTGNPNEIHKCVTITDTVVGTLGTDCVGTDPAVKTFSYQRTFTVVADTCSDNPNTATILQTGQVASQSVRVCGGVAGGLTMGFWQNKNGQGIITAGLSTSGVCNSATWLRQYAPFQDLSSTANCSQVALYVYNVIKAANSSGSSMNAMLKAQMLATALDVYFSDASLGGNKISAPAPLGGIKVDLTAICNMLDGSGGASCSGSFQNASSAFGGATCLSVSALLNYAASQSNVGGSTWYGNVKSTQQLAKNTFDAINNQQAFAC